MKTIRLALSVAWKEIQVLMRDRGALGMLLLFPILLSSVQGGANLMANPEGDSYVLDDCRHTGVLMAAGAGD